MRMGRLVTRMLGGGCAVFLCAAATAFVAVAHAQDTYAIGVSGALTGPPASINAPPIEGLRLYVDRLNSLGGINGKRVRLSILDDQAEPSKAAANAKRLLTQDNVILLILSSLSSTYAPVVAEIKRANVPLMFMGAVCPKEVYPPAEPLEFCTTAYAGGYDSRATLAFIKETAKEPVRLGFAAMAIPLSRGEIDYAEGQSKAMGMTPVDKEVIPRRPPITPRLPPSSRMPIQPGYSPGLHGLRRSRHSKRCAGLAGSATISPGRTSRLNRNWRG